VEFARLLFLFLHLLGMGVLIGAFLLQRRVAPAGPLNSGWLHGGLLQLGTGIVLVAIAEAGPDPVNHARVAVKLLVMLIILGLIVALRRREPLPAWVAPVLGGLVVVNTAVAVFWSTQPA
jgi:hypothetical protein